MMKYAVVVLSVSCLLAMGMLANEYAQVKELTGRTLNQALELASKDGHIKLLDTQLDTKQRIIDGIAKTETEYAKEIFALRHAQKLSQDNALCWDMFQHQAEQMEDSESATNAWFTQQMSKHQAALPKESEISK